MIQPIDWPKLLGDLAYLGLTGRDLGRAAWVSEGAVKKWATGGAPSPRSGARLERLWCSMTGKPRQFLPRNKPGSIPKPVPGLDSNEDHEPAYVHLEQLQQLRPR